MDGNPFADDDCAKQWEILLLLLASEVNKFGITFDDDGEVKTMDYFFKQEGIKILFKRWLAQMRSSYSEKVTDTDTAKKSETSSLYWRQQGNKCFQKGLIKESYKCYTKSVLYAKPLGTMYPLALANRSAALLHMKRFEECLKDIELAIVNRYPKEQQHKLFLRQTDCYIELNEPVKAKEAFEKAKEYLLCESSQININVAFRNHIKTLETKLKTIKDDLDIKAKEEELPNQVENKNIDFVSASKSLELRVDGKWGRHVVSNAPAQRGDILFDEEAYAFVALPFDEGRAIACEACCQNQINAVPCEHCSRSIYCSVACRDQGWKVFHQWECAGAQASLFPTIGIAHLALRVLLVSADKGFPPIEKQEDTNLEVADVFKQYSSVNTTQIYKSDVPDFYRMFNLVANFEKMQPMDYIQYAMTATMLTLYLECHTTFFKYLPSRLPFSLSHEDMKLFCGALMLRHLGQLVCNGHAALTLATVDLSEEADIGSQTQCEREVRYSTAIYPSAAMMNHSCDPNIINMFYRNRLIIRCGRDIPAGGEVLNCYGPHKARDTYEQRRSQLYQQYYFRCECDSCTDVEKRDFVLMFSAFSCQFCNGAIIRGRKELICHQCKTTNFDLNQALRILQAADQLLITAKDCTSQQLIEKIQAAMMLKEKVYHQHNVEMRHLTDYLARLYTEQGEYSKSIDLIKQNIQSLEYQFGSFSVEVAHDLRKLADVMFERLLRASHHPLYKDLCLETHIILKKAAKLMELNYGSWEPLVRRLRHHEASVAAILRERFPQTDALHHNFRYNLKI